MAETQNTDSIFFDNSDLDKSRLEIIVDESLKDLEDGELYMEYSQSESLTFDDGHLKNASFDTSQGFGLRGVEGELTGFAHSTDLSEDGIRRAAETIKTVKSGKSVNMGEGPIGTNQKLYMPENPINDFSFSDKVALLEEIDSYTRAKDPRIKQVTATVFGEWQVINIIRSGGKHISDFRPLVRLGINVVMEDGQRMEAGSQGYGGRFGYFDFFQKDRWQDQVDEAIRQASVNLTSIAAPAGEMEVVLGPGWPGVLLHEAIGHGLEGDFNRKKTSAFSGLMGERVAAKGVTVVDNGTLDKRRGSLTIDDEGSPTENTVLIEDGILKNYMQDRMNARLMGMKPTGNGRRQSYAHAPMPRMTNTYMLEGKEASEDIIKSVKDGLYAVNFGGGQVDITNGKFVFSCTEAYKVKNGKILEPVKGATLIGSGPEVLKHVSMIGNDLKLDPGVGTCGKGGQSVPAGVGQPTLKIDQLTVGGTSN